MAAEEPSEPDSSQDVAAAAASPNPCCAKLWKKYQKLETSRNALREAVKILQKENDKLQKENCNLSKACKEERLRGDSAEEARETESAARDMLEKEVIELKAQTSNLQKTRIICKHENEFLRISELEEETRRLKQDLGEKRKRSEFEKKKVEEEKKKVLEAQKLLKIETSKAEENRRLADTESKAANEWRASCEKLKCEANEAREQLVAQLRKAVEAHKRAEAEKQKAMREKKRADSEKSEAEKNKKLVEVERKKAMEEKSRADHLFEKLDEEKKRSEDLQISIEVERKNAMEVKSCANHLFEKLEEERKQNEGLQRKVDSLCAGRETISSGKHGRRHLDIVAEGSNAKLLKEKLKLKKEQLKHVKNVLELDKAKRALIRQELHCLKQDWMQLLSRFNILDNHLAGGVEGIDDLTKLKQHPEIHGLEQNLFPHNSISAPYFGLQAGMLPFSSGVPRECTDHQLPRGSCTRPTSGTSSVLEPPVGSSLRIKSQSSDKSSYPASFSDKKFMGSQGKDRFFVSSSADMRKNFKQRSPIVDLSKDAQKQDNGALMEVSGGSFQEKTFKSISGGREAMGKVSNGSRKRKRTQKSLESATCLCTEHNQLHSKMNEKDSHLNDLLASKADRSCAQANNMTDVPCLTEDDLQNHKNKRQVIGDKAPCFSDPAKVPFPLARDPSAISSEFASLLSFEEMIKEDCLKLLNLDNDADEERYRIAIEAPLSPDLPSIVSSSIEEPVNDDSHYLVDATVNKLEDETDCLVSRFDVIDLEIRSNLLEVKETPVHELTLNDNKLHPSFNRLEGNDSVKQICANSKSNAMANISCDAKSIGELIGFPVEPEASVHCLLHEDEALDPEAPRAAKSGLATKPVSSGSRSCTYQNSILHLQQLHKDAPAKTSTHQIYNASVCVLQSVVETNKTQAAESSTLTSTSIMRYHHGVEQIPKYIVGLMNMKTSNIMRILHYWKTLICETSNVSEKVGIDGPLLEKVSLEPELLPEEKNSVIFSLLLCNVCWRVMADPIVDGNFALSAISLTVKSDMETRWVFLKNIQVDILLSLIEDFLLNREVVMCGNVGCAMPSLKSSKCYHVDGTDIHVSSTAATIDQFISGCILLASICVEVDRVDVVLEVSYKILQMGRSNLSWTLLALHVFASICGERFLSLNSCNFLVMAVRLVVLLLETRDKSLCLVSSHVQSNCWPTAFSPCRQCLFDIDSVSVDNFISSLLDELELCTLLRDNHVNSNESTTRWNGNSKFGSSGLEIECGESCNIYKQGKLTADCPNYLAGRDLCYFAEIISLLELFGSYMSWEWTYNNVVIRLLKILESCRCEEYSAALLVLVGHLGRFVIGDGGHGHKAVEELKSKLLVLIEANITKSRSLPVQLAAIGALLSLLPLTFNQIVDMHAGPLLDPSHLQIWNWFSQLSREHQSLACSFFS